MFSCGLPGPGQAVLHSLTGRSGYQLPVAGGQSPTQDWTRWPWCPPCRALLSWLVPCLPCQMA